MRGAVINLYVIAALPLVLPLFRLGPGRGEAVRPALFPFVLPWDDDSLSVTNISGWLHKPAGKFGPIRAGPDGHLYAGGSRIRFFGVNLCAGACFPRKGDAERVAARMAKFGINIVRFHHMDAWWTRSNLFDESFGDTRHFDREALDRLDYFVAQLKGRGIYVNLNLLVSRLFKAADGLPPEVEELNWKERHILGFFYEPCMRLQMEFAGKLLGHRNPYTGLTYAEDPAVAFVEVVNENGLIKAWLRGKVDRLPGVFLEELQRQWNRWLRAHYGSTERLRKAWKEGEEPLGSELVGDGDFSRGLGGWLLELHGGAKAKVEVVSEAPTGLRRSARIEVERCGLRPWHVQFNRPGIRVEEGRSYTLSFWARADQPCTITVGLQQAHAPWRSLGFSPKVSLSTRWRRFEFTISVPEGDKNARINFTNLGARRKGTYWLAGVSLRPGGVWGLKSGERLEDESVPVFLRSRFGERTPRAQRDWIKFLWETEERFWRRMYRFLKEELKVRALVIGTIVGCSPPNLMAKLDCVDTHSYWQHPIRPFQPLRPREWVVRNISMVNDGRGGALWEVAKRRILGKPHSVTEYNHGQPNTYGSEAFLLLAAYAAFQDWDAIYAFDYSGRLDAWGIGRIPNHFSIDQHPTKMVTLVPAAAMFLRGDVAPGRRVVVASLSREQELEELRKRTQGQGWALVNAEHLGIRPEAMLVHRVAIAVEGTKAPAGALAPSLLRLEGERRFVSDTGELVWDLTREEKGVVTVNSERSKAVVGYGGGRRFELGWATIEPGATLQGGWSAITLTVMEGDPPPGEGRLLITATGYVENTDMGWKEVPGYPPRSSCGDDWGKAPTVVEGIPAKVTLSAAASKVRAWALDECGRRREQVPVKADHTGRAVLVIGPKWRTLWYEVVIQ